MEKSQTKDTVNKRALWLSLIPLFVTVCAIAGLYYAFVIKDAAPKVLRIATDIPGSAKNELIEAIGQQLEKNVEGLKVIFVATTGTEENIHLLEKGKVDVAAIPADALARPNFSLIAALYPDTYHFLVHADSKISSLHDIERKLIAVPPVTSAAYRSFWILVGQYGLSPELIRAHPMTPQEAFTAIRKNQIAAMFYTRPPANRRTRWIAEAVRVRLLDIDQAKAMAVRYGSLTAVTIPKGIYAGKPPLPARDIQSVATQSILITRSDLSFEIARALTAVMFDNRRELTVNSRLATFITKPDLEAASILPIHPGARAFYDRDQPSFWQTNAEPIGVVISIIAILISGFMWLKRRWEERQKGRIDVYNLELVNLTENARASNTIADLAVHKTALFDMLSNVVRDLDEDKIDGDGFHFFAFTWEAAFSVITEKERQMGVQSQIPPEMAAKLARKKKRSGVSA